MKKLLIILFSLGLAFGASAQRFHGGGHYGGGHYYSRPRVGVSLGVYAPYAPYYGYGYSPYSPYGIGYNPYRVGYARPSKLGLQIEDIQNDYQDRIWSARHDNSLSGKERRHRIHDLKHERDQAVIDAKRNYYKY